MPPRGERFHRISRQRTRRSLVLLALLATMSILTLPAFQLTATAVVSYSPRHTAQTDKPLQLSIQGKQLYEAGKFSEALQVWQQAEKEYAQLKNHDGVTQSWINIAEAQQAMGHYSQACNTLLQTFNFTAIDCQQLIASDGNSQKQRDALLKTLAQQPNSLNKAIGLRSLGDVWQRLDALELSTEVLQLSLKAAQIVSSPEDESAALLSLGNAFQARGNRARARQEIENQLQPTPWRCPYRPSLGASRDLYRQAATFYQQAAAKSDSAIWLPAQINRLNALLESNALSEAQDVLPQIQTKLQQLPANKTVLYAQLNLAQSLTCLKQTTAASALSHTEIARILAIALKQARSQGNQRAESYALGYLGGLYAQNQQWANAKSLTQQALATAQAIDAADIAYQWQWQLGYLLKSQGNLTEAISAYTEAVNTLKTLRNDIAATSRDLQFSFSEAVEPVYRQLVDLLLHNNEVNQESLMQAQNVIEALQVAELENLLRCNLQVASPVSVERVAEPTAAAIYPIILADRIEVILSLPNQPLRHYSSPLPKEQKLADRIETWRQQLQAPNNVGSGSVKLSQQLYDWLLRPIDAELTKSGIKTLVFVPDSALRNMPMAALHDGQHYLIEKYALVISPSLQLLQPQLKAGAKLEVLAAGISQKIPGFSAPALPEVNAELTQIKQLTNSVVLRNQQFTRRSLEDKINSRPFNVVHLATHGQFSSSPNQTYIRAWDERIDINQLRALLQARENNRADAIELLVLSACDTAAGDKRAALGLAGVAVRAGARSTLASLWQVKDNSVAAFMENFYQTLSSSPEPTITKAQALQKAQLELLREYKVPFYWAPYVLVGSWL